MFARLSTGAEASCALLTEDSESRQMVCSKSRLACCKFGALLKACDALRAHNFVCGICMAVVLVLLSLKKITFLAYFWNVALARVSSEIDSAEDSLPEQSCSLCLCYAAST
jgi:hypothetical protein